MKTNRDVKTGSHRFAFLKKEKTVNEQLRDTTHNVWEPSLYEDFDQTTRKEVSMILMSTEFMPKHGLLVEGFGMQDLHIARIVCEALSESKLPFSNVFKGRTTLSWEVTQPLKTVTIEYKPEDKKIVFRNVTQEERNRVRGFVLQSLDKTLCFAMWNAIARAILIFGDRANLITFEDLDFFAAMCGWHKFPANLKYKREMKRKEPEEISAPTGAKMFRADDLITKFANPNPVEAFAEYFATYIINRDKIEELLSRDGGYDDQDGDCIETDRDVVYLGDHIHRFAIFSRIYRKMV